MENEEKLKVHKALGDIYYIVTEDEDIAVLDCLVEFDGQFIEMTLSHPDEEMMYDIVKHFKRPTIEPYVIGDQNEFG